MPIRISPIGGVANLGFGRRSRCKSDDQTRARGQELAFFVFGVGDFLDFNFALSFATGKFLEGFFLEKDAYFLRLYRVTLIR